MSLLELRGKYRLTQIFGALSQTINQYYQFQKPAKNEKIEAGQFFTFNAKIKNDDLIRKFVPELKSFETINITGNYDADSQKIEIDGQIPQVLYGENSIENADSLEFCAQVVRVQAVRLNAIKTKHPWNSQYQKP